MLVEYRPRLQAASYLLLPLNLAATGSPSTTRVTAPSARNPVTQDRTGANAQWWAIFPLGEGAGSRFCAAVMFYSAATARLTVPPATAP
jgi:hypothetical protein